MAAAQRVGAPTGEGRRRDGEGRRWGRQRAGAVREARGSEKGWRWRGFRERSEEGAGRMGIDLFLWEGAWV